jgi:ATP-binding cassette subfamily B protein
MTGPGSDAPRRDGAAPATGPAPETGADADVPRPPAAELRGGPGSGRMASFGAPPERSKNFRATARRLLGRMAPDRFRLSLVAVMALCSVALVALGPRVLGRATDVIVEGLRGGPAGGGVDLGRLHRTLTVALGLYAASFVLSYVQSFVLAGVVQRTMSALRAEVEAKIHRLPLGYLDRNARGDLLSRVTNDIDNVAQSLQQTLSQLLTSLLTIVAVLGMMFVVSPLLATVAALTVPASVLTLGRIAKRSKTRFIAQWRHTGSLNGLIEEAFTGHAVVKAFGRTGEFEARFAEDNRRLYEASFGAQFLSGTIQPAMMFIGNVGYVALAVVGAIRVTAGAITIGDVQAIIQYSRQFTQPLTHTASMVNVLQSGIASAERVFELLDADEETPDPPEPAGTVEPVEPGTAGHGRGPGRVVFESVRFAYEPERPLIEDFSLVAEPGTTVAIVGPTGAGKTTLVNLILRFYELDGGRITVDGRDITTMSRRALRARVGMVLQDTWLFRGTIRDNIGYGRPGATNDEIVAAARAAHVDRFVSALPDGYDTIVDDEGGTVSAGEKQLLTIARAFLADPAILILDEATSSVDSRTELLIGQAMTALRARRTSFVIAHRLSTIRDADVIVVVDGGRIVEQGSHGELLARDGAYAALYRAQFGAASAEPA